MRKSFNAILFIAIYVVSSIVAAAPTVIPRKFVLPQHGSLQLNIPAGWQVQVRQAEARLPITIVMRPRRGEKLEMLLTPLWKMPGANRDFNSSATIRRLVDEGRRHVAPRAVEKNIRIKTLGGHNIGYYFGVTDRAPKPGEYRYMIQGAAGVGNLLMTFTVLSNNQHSALNDEALDVVRSAVHRPENIHTRLD